MSRHSALLPADLLTPEELARLFRVSPKTLANWRSRGGGPPFARVGGCIRYSGARAAEWFAERNGDY
jgi:DNA-binding transcriptional MerR regulator